MSKISKQQVARKALAMMAGVLVCAGASSVTATQAAAAMFKAPDTASSNIIDVEWQGGKPAKNSDWDKGGGYGGKPAGQGGSSNGSGQNKGWDNGNAKSSNGQGNSGNGGWKPSNQNGGASDGGSCDWRCRLAKSKGSTGSSSGSSSNSSKNSGIWKGADPCTVKFVPGSAAWNACKGIKPSGSSKKPENAFLSPAQCAAKFKKGSREYIACTM